MPRAYPPLAHGRSRRHRSRSLRVPPARAWRREGRDHRRRRDQRGDEGLRPHGLPRHRAGEVRRGGH
ncbi:hypothetical protein C1X83_35470, partial [Pseudomonas sp. GP01-A4]